MFSNILKKIAIAKQQEQQQQQKQTTTIAQEEKRSQQKQLLHSNSINHNNIYKRNCFLLSLKKTNKTKLNKSNKSHNAASGTNLTSKKLELIKMSSLYQRACQLGSNLKIGNKSDEEINVNVTNKLESLKIETQVTNGSVANGQSQVEKGEEKGAIVNATASSSTKIATALSNHTSSMTMTAKLIMTKMKEETVQNVNESKESTSGRFVDEPEYRMNYPERGVALIINNKYFQSHLEMPIRDGTDRDAYSLETTLRKLSFDVRVFNNCTAANMCYLMNKLAREDHSRADCFLSVILTHGDKDCVFGTDASVEIDGLLQPFRHNKSLAGKPKLFFIQACRGTNLMDGIDTHPFEVNYVKSIPIEADFLVHYSTISGYYSWRNSLNGSWFIQSLCKVLDEHSKSLEIMHLLTAVNRRVAYYYESNTNDPHMNGKRQVPCIVSMLTKELYFRVKPRSSAHVSITYT
jgi:hypothetical protein